MIDLSLFSPRVGVSYALDESGRTLLRASYGMFGSQLGSGTVQTFSAASQAILIYDATDRNGNNVADPGELGELLDLDRRRSGEPGGGRELQPRRSGSEVAEDPRARGRPRSRAGAAVRRQRGVDVAAVQRRDLERHRPDARQHHLSAGRRRPVPTTSRRAWRPGDVAPARRLQPGLLHAAARRACRSATAASTAIVPTTTSTISGSRCRRPSGCRTTGWAASGSRPTATASTSTTRRRPCRTRRRRPPGRTSTAART